MPSLLRFLTILAVLGAIGVAAMLALATLVHVTPRPMEHTIPPGKLR